MHASGVAWANELWPLSTGHVLSFIKEVQGNTARVSQQSEVLRGFLTSLCIHVPVKRCAASEKLHCSNDTLCLGFFDTKERKVDFRMVATTPNRRIRYGWTRFGTASHTMVQFVSTWPCIAQKQMLPVWFSSASGVGRKSVGGVIRNVLSICHPRGETKPDGMPCAARRE